MKILLANCDTNVLQLEHEGGEVMGTMKLKVGMGVRFSPFTMQRLRQVCKVEGLSKGQLVREAVDRD